MIPLGGNVKDGRAVRVVASVGEDVRLRAVDVGPGLPPADAGAFVGFVVLVIRADSPDDIAVVGACPVASDGELKLLEYKDKLLSTACPAEILREDTAASEPAEPVPPAPIPKPDAFPDPPMLDVVIVLPEPYAVPAFVGLESDVISPEPGATPSLLALRVCTKLVEAFERVKRIALVLLPEDES